MPDSPVISGVADLPKFYFAEGAPFRLTLTIGAEISMSGKFVTFGMRARSGTVRRVFGTDSGESNLTIAGQVITLDIATSAATVPAFASGWTLEDVQTKGETEYWVDISATEGSDVLLRLQGQADWVAPGSDIAESSAVVASPSINVAITSGAVSASVAVIGGGESTLTTNTATSGLSGILKAASNTLEVATAGTDYVATNDSRLTDARTPTSHVHGGISNAGAIGSTSGLPIKTGTSGVLEVGAFGTSSGQFAQGNDARFHDRSHAITSTSDHTAGNWKVFHSNDSGQLVELALGADGTVLKSNGASVAPSFAAQSSITGTGFAYVRTTGNNATAVIGDPSKPYSSVSEAYNAGARSFDLGPGQFGLSQSFAPGGQTTSIYVRGVGVSGSNISVFVLSWVGANGYYNNGSDYANGVTPPPLILSSDKSVDLRVTLGGGDSPPLAGYSAGNVPNYDFRNCYIGLLTLTPGSGVSGGTAGNQASSGSIEFTTIASGTPVATVLKRNGVLQGTDTFYPNNVTTSTSTSITGLLKGNGTAVSAATAGTDYVEPSTFSTHTGSTTAHGISAFGATLVDDVDAAAARSTLGLATTDRAVFAGITLGQSILFSSDNTHSIGATGANRPLNIFLSGTLNAATNVFISSNSGAVYSGVGADTNISRKSAGVWQFGTNAVNSSGSWEATNGTLLGSLTVPKTITAGGTTGAQTINKISGSVNFAAAATSLVVTNSLVTASSVIQCTVATNDTTMKSVSVVAGAGSFTIYANAAPTAETRVNFSLTN